MGKNSRNKRNKRQKTYEPLLYRNKKPLGGYFGGGNHYTAVLGIGDLQSWLDTTTWGPSFTSTQNNDWYAKIKSIKLDLDMHETHQYNTTDGVFAFGAFLVSSPKQLTQPGTVEYIDSTWDLDTAVDTLMTTEYAVWKNKEIIPHFIGFNSNADIRTGHLVWNIPGPFIDALEAKEDPIMRQYLYIYAFNEANYAQKSAIFYNGSITVTCEAVPLKTRTMLRRW